MKALILGWQANISGAFGINNGASSVILAFLFVHHRNSGTNSCYIDMIVHTLKNLRFNKVIFLLVKLCMLYFTQHWMAAQEASPVVMTQSSGAFPFTNCLSLSDMFHSIRLFASSRASLRDKGSLLSVTTIMVSIPAIGEVGPFEAMIRFLLYILHLTVSFFVVPFSTLYVSSTSSITRPYVRCGTFTFLPRKMMVSLRCALNFMAHVP
jgi:hypothetical protein